MAAARRDREQHHCGGLAVALTAGDGHVELLAEEPLVVQRAPLVEGALVLESHERVADPDADLPAENADDAVCGKSCDEQSDRAPIGPCGVHEQGHAVGDVDEGRDRCGDEAASATPVHGPDEHAEQQELGHDLLRSDPAADREQQGGTDGSHPQCDHQLLEPPVRHRSLLTSCRAGSRHGNTLSTLRRAGTVLVVDSAAP